MTTTSTTGSTNDPANPDQKGGTSQDNISTGHSPYDVILYLAKSFGHALPVVLIICLVAVGAWYFIREVSSLQTKLIEASRQLSTAKVDQARAEAAAQVALDKAKAEILVEQTKRLSDLNDISVGVSKKIQDLVSGQLENMTKIEAQMAAQTKKAAENQKKSEESAKKEILMLRQQVLELEKRKQELTLEVVTASFNDVRAKLIHDAKEYRISHDLSELLRPNLKNPTIRKRIESDRKDKNLPWLYRALLNRELFSLTDNEAYLNDLETLLIEHKSELDYDSVFDLVERNPSWSKTSAESINKFSMKMIMNDSFSMKIREAFMGWVGYDNQVDKYVNELSPEKREQAAQIIGQLFLLSSEKGYSCYKYISLLNKLSRKALRAFTDRALKSDKYVVSHECIREELSRLGNVSEPLNKN